MTSVYLPEHLDNPRSSVGQVVEEMRTKLSKEFGVTVTGNRCTVRWYIDGQLVDVHMAILRVTTVEEARQHMQGSQEMKELYKKYPDLAAELYHAENGEWPK